LSSVFGLDDGQLNILSTAFRLAQVVTYPHFQWL
jgi:hypothetical protein